MKKLTKPFVVLFTKDKQIVKIIENNTDTGVPDSIMGAEFDSLQEMQDFIETCELKKYELTE